MFHDKNLINNAENELFSLGEGQIGYVRLLTEQEHRLLPEGVELEKAWAVFSAQGEMLAVCDSSYSALSFFADHALLPVSLH